MQHIGILAVAHDPSGPFETSRIARRVGLVLLLENIGEAVLALPATERLDDDRVRLPNWPIAIRIPDLHVHADPPLGDLRQ